MREYVKKPPKNPPRITAAPWNGEPVPGEELDAKGRYVKGCWMFKYYLTPGCMIVYRKNKDGECYPCSVIPGEKFAEEWEAV